jgi:glycosyltransferase involved in cell wall biosynthesis
MPCLNEADTVATCVRKALGGLAAAGIAGEVIVADNGSSDGSIALAEAAGARVGGGECFWGLVDSCWAFRRSWRVSGEYS